MRCSGVPPTISTSGGFVVVVAVIDIVAFFDRTAELTFITSFPEIATETVGTDSALTNLTSLETGSTI